MKNLLALSILFFCSFSRAGIMIEPYVGTELGTTKNASGKLTGSDYGLRLAYKAPLMFWAGLDTTMGSVTSKPDGSSSTSGKRTTLSGVLGVDFPILVRGWIGTSLSDEIKYTSSKEKGQSTKVGLGYTGLPFVSLNFEYITEKFTDLDGATVSPAKTNNSYLISLSLPWTL